MNELFLFDVNNNHDNDNSIYPLDSIMDDLDTVGDPNMLLDFFLLDPPLSEEPGQPNDSFGEINTLIDGDLNNSDDNAWVSNLLNNEEEMSLPNIVARFCKALSSQKINIAMSLWGGNKTLQRWCHGEVVLLDGEVKTISHAELLELFRSALSSQHKDIIKIIWVGNETLQKWSRGEAVQVDREKKIISHAELIELFRSALPSKQNDVIKAIWNENENLRKWCRGEVVQVEGKEKIISNAEMLKLFCGALSSKSQYIIKNLWYRNTKLQHFCITEETSGHDLVKIFEKAISARFRKDIVLALWAGNKKLKKSIIYMELFNEILERLLTQVDVNNAKDFITEYTAWLVDINKSSIVANVFAKLKIPQNKQTKILCEKIEFLSSLIEKHNIPQLSFSCDVAIDNTATNPNHRKSKEEVSLLGIVSRFYTALCTRQDKEIIELLWSENEKLRKWCRGEVVQVDGKEKIISNAEMLKLFCGALTSKNQYIIKNLWDKNKKLQHFCITDEISEHDLVKIFEKAISARFRKDIVLALWAGNKKLKKAIIDKKLYSQILEKLLAQVEINNTKNFITEYAAWLVDINKSSIVIDIFTQLNISNDNTKILSKKIEFLSSLIEKHNIPQSLVSCDVAIANVETNSNHKKQKNKPKVSKTSNKRKAMDEGRSAGRKSKQAKAAARGNTLGTVSSLGLFGSVAISADPLMSSTTIDHLAVAHQDVPVLGPLDAPWIC